LCVPLLSHQFGDENQVDALALKFRKHLPEHAQGLAMRVAAIAATEMGLKAHGGHGLTYRNVQTIAGIREIAEVSIGHSVVSRAVLVGMDLAVREMLVLLEAPE